METKQITTEKLESRLEKSLQDYSDENVISVEDLIDEIEDWN